MLYTSRGYVAYNRTFRRNTAIYEHKWPKNRVSKIKKVYEKYLKTAYDDCSEHWDWISRFVALEETCAKEREWNPQVKATM